VAVSTVSIAPEHSSGYNQIIYEVSSDNTSQANFNFVIDTYIGGVKVNRQLYPKQPGSTNIKFDASNVVRNYLQSDFFNASAFFSYNTNSQTSYFLQVGEAYDDASGILTIYPDLTRIPTSGQYRAYNSVFDFEAFNKFSFMRLDVASGFFLQDTSARSYVRSGQRKVLTYFDPAVNFSALLANGQPTITVIGDLPPNLLVNQFLSGTGIPIGAYITNVNPTTKVITMSANATTTGAETITRDRQVTGCKVKQYDSSNNLLDTNTQSISYTGSTYVYNIAPQLISGFSLNPNTAYYVTELYYTIGLIDVTLASYTTYIDDSCSNFDVYRLHWLNQYGGWEAFNFNKLSVPSVEVNRKQYKKFQALDYSPLDRLKTNYNTEIVDTVRLNSDWITDEQATWLESLFLSPVIWLELNGEFTAVQLSDTNYEVREYLNGRTLHNITCNMQYSYNRYRQSL